MAHKIVALIGATDRFNYGDLLFPLLIDEFLKENQAKISLRNFSLIKSDLTAIGAMKTESYDSFLSLIKKEASVNVIVAGGEVLGSNWLNLYAYLSNRYNCLQNFNKLTRGKLLSLLIKIILHKSTICPFILNKSIHPNITIFYNSVGGIPTHQQQFLSMLDADYISHRSRSGYNILKKNGVNAYLNPDSAILMSHFWSPNFLKSKLNLNFVLPEKYIYFQINKQYSLGKEALIIEQLEKIYNEVKLPIVLCPIGLAIGHEDFLPLSSLDCKLNIPHLLVKSPTIWDIMFLISNSSLYIGTSLHGIITAMSYCVPYIGLNRSPKISDYLETWGIARLNKPTELVDISRFALEILKANFIGELKNSLTNMQTQSFKSLKIMSDLLR